MICGWCVANGHVFVNGVDVLSEAILEAILLRDEAPIERVLASMTPRSRGLQGEPGTGGPRLTRCGVAGKCPGREDWRADLR